MNPAKPEQPESGLKRQVVYMPSCVTRMMGPSLSDTERASVHEKMLSIFEKAGYEVIYPEASCKTPVPSALWTVRGLVLWVYVPSQSCRASSTLRESLYSVAGVSCRPPAQHWCVSRLQFRIFPFWG